MKQALKFAATATVVVLIVAPIPPSTIIGLAIVANKRTNKYLDDYTVGVTVKTMGVVGRAFGVVFQAEVNAKLNQVQARAQQKAQKVVK